MMMENPFLAEQNSKWHTYNKNGTLILTDIAPADVVKDYNEHVVFWKLYIGKDYVIHPNQFYEMRTRIGYNIDQILKEMEIIYTVVEIDKFKKERKI